jgi:hypothetical protein
MVTRLKPDINAPNIQYGLQHMRMYAASSYNDTGSWWTDLGLYAKRYDSGGIYGVHFGLDYGAVYLDSGSHSQGAVFPSGSSGVVSHEKWHNVIIRYKRDPVTGRGTAWLYYGHVAMELYPHLDLRWGRIFNSLYLYTTGINTSYMALHDKALSDDDIKTIVDSDYIRT